MKVFKYDISRSVKGEQIADIGRPCATGAYVRGSDVTPPRHNPNTHQWSVIRMAEDKQGNPIKFPFPVCFCTGQLTCGTEAPVWDWVILLPTIEGV